VHWQDLSSKPVVRNMTSPTFLHNLSGLISVVVQIELENFSLPLSCFRSALYCLACCVYLESFHSDVIIHCGSTPSSSPPGVQTNFVYVSYGSCDSNNVL